MATQPMKSWTKPYGPYACHVDAHVGETPDNCVLSYGDNERRSCDFAKKRKSPCNCPHWKRRQASSN